MQMRESRTPRSCRSWPLLYVGTLLAVVLPLVASAGDWKVTDDIGLSLTNVDRTGQSAQTGTVVELNPRWIAKGRGGRFTADINYAPNLAYGFDDTDPEALTHDLLATGRLEVVPDTFFLGAQAAAGITGTDSTSAPVDAINFNTDGGQQTFSLALLPEFRHHLNRYVDIVSDNSLDWVTYREGLSEDSSSIRLNLSAISGRYFGRSDWSVDGNYRETRYDARTDKRKDISGTLGYRVDHEWRVFGSLGYEDNDVDTDRSDTSGTIWDVGTDWTPSPRTSMSARYGQRYYGDTWSGSVNHRSRRTRLGVDFSREVNNRRTAQLVDSFFYLVDDTGNIITDPGTGAPIIANIPQLGETDEDYLEDRLRGIVTITGRRTTASISGTVSQRSYEVSGDDEDSLDLYASLSRRLGAGYTASVNGVVRQTDREQGSDSDSYDLSMSLSKTFSRRTSASVDLLYRDYNDDDPGEDYTERRIGLTLRANLL